MAASKKANLGKTNLEKANKNKTKTNKTNTNTSKAGSGRANTNKGSINKGNTNQTASVKGTKRNQGQSQKKEAGPGGAKRAETKEGKKGTPGRKTGKNSAVSAKKTETQMESKLYTEIFLWILLAVSILLMLSNFGVGGMIGSYISNLFFGLFGTVTYVFPIFLFFGTAFMISNSKNPKAYRNMAGFLLMFVTICTFMQLLTEGYYEGTTLEEYYRISALSQSGGGMLGGAICNVTAKAFGVAGTYVILIASAMISVVLVTQKSMFELIKKSGTKMYKEAKLERERWERQKTAQEVENSDEPQKDKQKTKRSKVTDSIAKMAELSKETLKKKEDAKKEPIKDFDDLHETEESEHIKNTKKDAEEGFNPQDAFPIHRAEEVALWDLEELTIPKKTEKKQQEYEHKEKEPEKKEILSAKEKQQIEVPQKEESPVVYEFPPITLLRKGAGNGGDSDDHLRNTAKKLQETLHTFGVNVTITNISCGPTVTRYEVQPELGVKVSKIVSLTDDIKLNLAATDIRIEAPIPGKAAIGIEVPNKQNSVVMLRDLIQSEAFVKSKSKLAFAAGKDIAGKPVIADIAKMPHLLIAGATGSGKSVCINTLIMSLLYKASPEEVKLIMIDPKVVELSVYNGIPHLLIPVVTEPKKAAGALNWAVAQMTERYNQFAEYNVRDIKGYNEKVDMFNANKANQETEKRLKKMPQIVVIVDELADLMMVAPGEVEDAICRLAQLARAAGIHLIIATQRPSVNVITGLIKANMPSRIAFSVSSGVDSRTIIDMNGAEKLLGKGDMLFYPQGYQKPARVQGAFISDKEVSAVVKFLSEQTHGQYDHEIEKQISNLNVSKQEDASSEANERDVYFADAGKFIIEKDKASIGMLQRVFKIGFNRAARIMDQLCEAGVVGQEEGTKPRKVLMSMEQFEQYIEEYL